MVGNFAGALNSTNAIVENQRMITKVYFPRLILPISAVLSGIVDLAIALVVCAPVFSTTESRRPWVVATAAVRVHGHRDGPRGWVVADDTQCHVPRRPLCDSVLIELLMFASPVIYSTSSVPQRWQWLYALNPMVSVIEGFRWAITGTNASEPRHHPLLHRGGRLLDARPRCSSRGWTVRWRTGFGSVVTMRQLVLVSPNPAVTFTRSAWRPTALASCRGGYLSRDGANAPVGLRGDAPAVLSHGWEVQRRRLESTEGGPASLPPRESVRHIWEHAGRRPSNRDRCARSGRVLRVWPSPVRRPMPRDRAFALQTPCFPRMGDGRTPVVFQRGNTADAVFDFRAEDLMRCPPLVDLIGDPSLLAIAQAYLGSRVVMDLVTMWWSTPGTGRPSSEAAQLYHFDMDRLKFLKVFFLMTDVDEDTGPHCYVRGSHQRKPKALLTDGRKSDEDIEGHYGDRIVRHFRAPGNDVRGRHSRFPQGRTASPRVEVDVPDRVRKQPVRSELPVDPNGSQQRSAPRDGGPLSVHLFELHRLRAEVTAV